MKDLIGRVKIIDEKIICSCCNKQLEGIGAEEFVAILYSLRIDGEIYDNYDKCAAIKWDKDGEETKRGPGYFCQRCYTYLDYMWSEIQQLVVMIYRADSARSGKNKVFSTKGMYKN